MPAISSDSSQGDGNLRTKSHMWTPTSLRRRTLASMAVLLAVFAIVLGVLYGVSQQNDGICNTNSRYYYLWTYGPTAIFTILLVLWTRIEDRVKQMQPWRLMARGPKDVSESVLLDYISPWNIRALYQAFKHRHIVVAAAVVASLLFRLLIVLSTGFFTVSQLRLTRTDFPITVHESFLSDGASYNPDLVDQRAAAFVIGLAQTNVSRPLGTTSTAAIQKFSVPTDLGAGVQSVEAVVEVISSSMHCEPAVLYIREKWSDGGFPSMTLRSNSFHAAMATSIARTGASVNPATATHSKYAVLTTYIERVYWRACGNISLGIAPGVSGLEIIRCPGRDASMKQTGLLLWSGLDVLKNNRTLNAQVCQPDLSLRHVSVIQSRSGDVAVADNAVSAALEVPNFQGWQIFSALEKSMHDAAGVSNIFTVSTESTFFTWLQLTEPSNSLLNATSLAPVFQRAWSGFAAQFFDLYFHQSASSQSTTGTVVIEAERLIVSRISFWLIESCLILVVGLSITIALCGSASLVPRDTSSIGGLATILSNSPSFMSMLRATGHLTVSQLGAMLRPYQFCTQKRGLAFSIQPSSTYAGAEESQPQRTVSKSATIHWYRPQSTRLVYQLSFAICLIAVVVTLEVLLRRSQQHHGLASVNSPAGYEHYLWTFVPTALMSGISAVIGLHYATVLIVRPYAGLSAGPQSASQTILPPWSYKTWFKTWKPQPPVSLLASGAALFLSQFLSIVASGLFTTVPASGSHGVSLKQQDRFNNRPATYGGQLEADMILTGNMTYPQFTHEGLAFSRYTSSSPDLIGNLNAVIPAIRGSMECVSQVVLSIDHRRRSTGDLTFIDVPNTWPGCEEGLNTYSAILSEWNIAPGSPLRLGLNVPNTGYFGGMASLAWEHFDKCPGYAGVFGHTNSGAIQSISVFTCKPNAESVLTNVSFEMPQMQLSTTPIVLNKISDANITFPLKGSNGIDPMALFQGGLTSGFLLNSSSPHDMFDSFMQALVYGTYGIAPSQLDGKTNVNRLFAAVSRQYGVLFAQYMNKQRVPVHGSNATEVPGKLTTRNGYRLSQSPISTQILVSLLAAILGCSVLTKWTMKTRHVLPKNPCSIAAVASLLADSDLLEEIGKVSEPATDDEIGAKFDGYGFSMGWWTGKEGQIGRRRFGIDFGKAQSA